MSYSINGIYTPNKIIEHMVLSENKIEEKEENINNILDELVKEDNNNSIKKEEVIKEKTFDIMNIPKGININSFIKTEDRIIVGNQELTEEDIKNLKKLIL